MSERNVDWPIVEKFLSPNEIVDLLFERLKDDPSAIEFIQREPIEYHHGFGTGVRNEFYLWHPENPHTMKDYMPDIQAGIDYNPRHADNACGVILERLHAKIKDYYANL